MVDLISSHPFQKVELKFKYSMMIPLRKRIQLEDYTTLVGIFGGASCQVFQFYGTWLASVHYTSRCQVKNERADSR